MTVAYQSTTTADNQVAASSIAVNKPASTVSGDLLIAWVVVNGGSVPTLLSGWSDVPGVSGGLGSTATNPKGRAMYRLCDGSEGSSFTFAHGAVNSAAAISRFTGVDQQNPFDQNAKVVDTASLVTSIDLATQTPTRSNCMLIGGAADNSSTVTFTPPSVPESWTEDYDSSQSLTTAGKSMTVAHDPTLQGVSATGTISFTSSAGRAAIGWVALLRSALGLRVSQDVLEVLVLASSGNLRVTQDVAEVLILSSSGNLRASQDIIEVLTKTTPPLYPAVLALPKRIDAKPGRLARGRISKRRVPLSPRDR